jgi:hypothetical protein
MMTELELILPDTTGPFTLVVDFTLSRIFRAHETMLDHAIRVLGQKLERSSATEAFSAAMKRRKLMIIGLMRRASH